MTEEVFRVAVVGGGLAGLSAAEFLSSQSNFGKENVVLLEATAHLGGRIQNVSGLAPWPVEEKISAVVQDLHEQIGPEFLHGSENSSIKKLVDEMGCVQRELSFRRLLSSAEAAEHPDIEQVHEMFKALVDEEPASPDMCVAEYLHKKGVNSTVMGLAEAIYGNDFGCSLDKLGLHECIQEANQWIYGDTYIILDRPLSSVVNYISRDLNVRENWAVKQVKHLKNGKVHLDGPDGCVVKADHVILAVPLTILQQGLISFEPPLPESKIRAAKAIGMSNVMKVVMVFSHQFWPKGLFDVVCTDSFLPELWITTYPKATRMSPEGSYPNGPLGQYTVMGFIAGDRASKVARTSEVEIFTKSLAQLDRMFGRGESSGMNALIPTGVSTSSKVSGRVFLRKDVIDSSNAVSSQTHPASHFFNGGMIVNWADRGFIHGGYSHPSVNAKGARSELAKPLGNIFFAGEATHPGVNPCLQSAIETGRRAACEVIQASNRRSLL